MLAVILVSYFSRHIFIFKLKTVQTHLVGDLLKEDREREGGVFHFRQAAVN